MASDTTYQMGAHSELLSSLLHNARASLGEIADQVGSYRQKVWRTVQGLENDLIWGYTAAVDEQRLGWRRYKVMFKVGQASNDFLACWRSLQAKMDANGSVRLIDAHVITGVDYNFMMELTCQNPIELQIFVDLVQSQLDTTLGRPPRVIECIHTLRLGGFANPDEATLAHLVEEMGLVDAQVTASP